MNGRRCLAHCAAVPLVVLLATVIPWPATSWWTTLTPTQLLIAGVAAVLILAWVALFAMEPRR